MKSSARPADVDHRLTGLEHRSVGWSPVFVAGDESPSFVNSEMPPGPGAHPPLTPLLLESGREAAYGVAAPYSPVTSPRRRSFALGAVACLPCRRRTMKKRCCWTRGPDRRRSSLCPMWWASLPFDRLDLLEDLAVLSCEAMFTSNDAEESGPRRSAAAQVITFRARRPVLSGTGGGGGSDESTEPGRGDDGRDIAFMRPSLRVGGVGSLRPLGNRECALLAYGLAPSVSSSVWRNLRQCTTERTA